MWDLVTAEGDSLRFNEKCKGLTIHGNTKKYDELQWNTVGAIVRGGAREAHRKIAKVENAMAESGTKQKRALAILRWGGVAKGAKMRWGNAMGGKCDGAIDRVANNCDGSNGHNQ